MRVAEHSFHFTHHTRPTRRVNTRKQSHGDEIDCKLRSDIHVISSVNSTEIRLKLAFVYPDFSQRVHFSLAATSSWGFICTDTSARVTCPPLCITHITAIGSRKNGPAIARYELGTSLDAGSVCSGWFDCVSRPKCFARKGPLRAHFPRVDACKPRDLRHEGRI